MADSVPKINDDDTLRRYGVVRVLIPEEFNASKWAKELSQLTPIIMAGEGDSQYAFYRNILDEPDFPFDLILKSRIGDVILNHFDVKDLDVDIRLDDAFCVSYNMDQEDTSGARHTDPSDITVNLCLETVDMTGSEVMFYGTRSINNCPRQPDDDKSNDFLFLVEQKAGYANVFWGSHPHETLKLNSGKRTNIILTYCYTDQSRSDVASRTCYA